MDSGAGDGVMQGEAIASDDDWTSEIEGLMHAAMGAAGDCPCLAARLLGRAAAVLGAQAQQPHSPDPFICALSAEMRQVASSYHVRAVRLSCAGEA